MTKTERNTTVHESEAEVCECVKVHGPCRNDLLEQGQRFAGVIVSLQGEGEFVHRIHRRRINRQRMTQ